MVSLDSSGRVIKALLEAENSDDNDCIQTYFIVWINQLKAACKYPFDNHLIVIEVMSIHLKGNMELSL